MTRKKNVEHKINYNKFKKLVKQEINKLINLRWQNFAPKFGNKPLSSRKFWKRLKSLGGKNDMNSPIKHIIHNKQSYKEDNDIANIFANQLHITFNEEHTNNYNADFKHEITSKVMEFTKPENPLNHNLPLPELINLKSLNKTIQKLKSSNGCGLDNISNILIKHLPKNIKLVIIHLFNLIYKANIKYLKIGVLHLLQ